MKATEKDILGVIMDMVNEGRARNGRWNSNRNRTRNAANEAYKAVMNESDVIYDPVTYAGEQQHIADVTGEDNDETFKDSLATYDYRVNPDAVYPEDKAIDNADSWDEYDRQMDRNKQERDFGQGAFNFDHQNYNVDPDARTNWYPFDDWDDPEHWKGVNGFGEAKIREHVRRIMSETVYRLQEASGKNKVEDALKYLESLDNDPEERKKFSAALQRSIAKSQKKRRSMSESAFGEGFASDTEGDEYDPWVNGDASWINGTYQDVCNYWNVEINTSLSYVSIEPKDGNPEYEYFLQGDESDNAIKEISRIWKGNGDNTMTQKDAIEQWLKNSGY